MKRDLNIDLIKSCAILFVVSVHFLLNIGFYDITIDTSIEVFWIAMRTIFITCVPLFLIATGFLMNKKKLTVQYIYGIIPVIVIYSVTSLIDWLFSYCFMNDDTAFFDAVKGIFSYSTNSYSWYVEMYFGLYCLIPFLNIIWHESFNKRYHQLILLIGSILCFLPSLLNVYGKVLPDYWQMFYPIVYYFFGVYLYTYQEELKKISYKRLLGLLFCFLVMFTLFETINSWGREFQWLNANDYFGFEVAIMTIILSIILLKLPVSGKLTKPLKWISSATLSIYLMSDLTDKIVYPWVKKQIPDLQEELKYGFLIIFLAVISAVLSGCVIQASINKVMKRFKYDAGGVNGHD